MAVRILDVGPASSRHALTIQTDLGRLVLPRPIVKALGLTEGSLFDSLEALEAAALEIAPSHAQERLLRLLGYRERSVEQARTSLLDDGYPTAIVDPLIARFIESELLDDARFTRMFIRTHRASGKGRQRIQRELTTAGVPVTLIETTLQEECPETDEIERALVQIRRRPPRDRRERERLRARLLRRGFSYEVTHAALALADGFDTESQPIDQPPQT